MPLNLTGPQDTITSFFHRFTLRRGNGETSPCDLSARGGRLEEGAAAIQQRIEYTIELPARTTIELDLDEVVTVDETPGREYRITYAPPAEVINLGREYGAVEVS
jgi:hypothetical protein